MADRATLTPQDRERLQLEILDRWARITPAEKQQRRYIARKRGQSAIVTRPYGSAVVVPIRGRGDYRFVKAIVTF